MWIQTVLTSKSYLGFIFFPFSYKALEFLGGFWRLLLNKSAEASEGTLSFLVSLFYNLCFKFLMRAIARHAVVFET